jgi:hypothetical protein
MPEREERYFETRPDDLGDGYSIQTGHFFRGVSDGLKRKIGIPPKCVGIDVQDAQNIRRKMRRVPRSGK